MSEKTEERATDRAEAFARNMWKLHHMLIAYCGNLVYGLIFNTFKDFYRQLATYYYTHAEHQALARALWEGLTNSIKAQDPETASRLMTNFITGTTDFWVNITFEQYQKEVLDDPLNTDEDMPDPGQEPE